ncbi:unnamed protein product [Moneuplotes crassus]|uniref:Uncharacterized protein n=1 Tax=Euplotes crassus TaxID=5936 RepID=A0AAD1U4I6_EUPCR|nr:unnamed protein product [Moneuplotes crassus]
MDKKASQDMKLLMYAKLPCCYNCMVCGAQMMPISLCFLGLLLNFNAITVWAHILSLNQ